MKAVATKLPASAVPVATKTRAWDGAVVDFYVVKRWRRSHDRTLDGTSYYVPVAAVAGQVIWSGAGDPDESAARAAAMQTHDSIPGAT